MLLKKQFKETLLSANNYNFNEKALLLFEFQAHFNPVYKKFIELLSIDIKRIQSIFEIPFLPINTFKNHKVFTGEEQVKEVFYSSGTSNHRSRHFIADPEFYQNISVKGFERYYGELKNYIIVALLPSYQENTNSSLIFMVDHFISATENKYSTYVTLNEVDKIKNVIENRGNKKVLIIGVTYALLEIPGFNLRPEEVIIMETGGMKGRGEEKTREQVHSELKAKFGVNVIHSEYGMTELLSQAYSKKKGLFETPPWMKVVLREINDPFALGKVTSGGINIIDLSNIDSCAFIETEDLGQTEDGQFKVIGRLDNSEMRGCNQLVF